MAIRLSAKREARSERGLRIGRAVAQASTTGIGLVACEEDLDELIGYVAADANHETNRRRQKRLDLAFAALSDALEAMGS